MSIRHESFRPSVQRRRELWFLRNNQARITNEGGDQPTLFENLRMQSLWEWNKKIGGEKPKG